MSAVLKTYSHEISIVYVQGPLRVPVNRDVRSSVHRLLGRGQRAIVLDLAGVSRIDAAGVSELVRAYNMAFARNGSLQIVHATRWVREILERVGLFALLSADRGTRVA